LSFVGGSLNIIPFVNLDSFIEDVVENYEVNLAIVGFVFKFVKTVNSNKKSLGIAFDITDVVFKDLPELLVLLS
jgi:hypothetical protein